MRDRLGTPASAIALWPLGQYPAPASGQSMFNSPVLCCEVLSGMQAWSGRSAHHLPKQLDLVARMSQCSTELSICRERVLITPRDLRPSLALHACVTYIYFAWVAGSFSSARVATTDGQRTVKSSSRVNSSGPCAPPRSHTKTLRVHTRRLTTQQLEQMHERKPARTSATAGLS